MPNAANPKTAVELCRQMAAEIWSGDRVHVSEPVGGLNTETAVRVRLRNILSSLEMGAAGLTEETYQHMLSIDILRDAPLSVLEKCEAMMTSQMPGTVQNLDLFTDADQSVLGGLSRLIICQSIAARMGVWAVRHEELEDARIAHSIFRTAEDAEGVDVEDLREQGNALYREKAYQEAAAHFLAADRVRRSIEGLFKLSVCMWRTGDTTAALWAIRACLLEDLAAFPSAKWLLKAQMVESNLKSRQEQPMESETEAIPLSSESFAQDWEEEGTVREHATIAPSDLEEEDVVVTVLSTGPSD